MQSMDRKTFESVWASDWIRGYVSEVGTRPSRTDLKFGRGGALDTQFLAILQYHDEIKGIYNLSQLLKRIAIGAVRGSIDFILGTAPPFGPISLSARIVGRGAVFASNILRRKIMGVGQ